MSINPGFLSSVAEYTTTPRSKLERIANQYGYTNAGYLSKKAEDGSTYGEHFGAELAADSTYFNNLKEVMDCVDHHKQFKSGFSEEDATTACGRQFENLKASAIGGGLKFHQVNAKFYVRDIFLEKKEKGY